MQIVCSEVRFCEKSRVKRSFWKLGLSLFTSLVENAHLGSLDCHFWWKSRGKCSFWKLGFSLLVQVSCKTLVLEVWIVTFGASLVENARFGSLDCHFLWKSCGKCSFWKLGLSNLVKVSWKMLVLEAWIVACGESLVENARFGSLDSHFWWMSRGKCSLWKLGLSLLVKVSSRAKRSFWKLGLSLLVKVSWKMLVLEDILHYINITLHYVHYTHYVTLHCFTLHYTTLHTSHYIPLHCVTLLYHTLHYITLQYITLHYITLHYITLHYITLHYITAHCSTLHTLHTLHYITSLHYITFITFITLHYIT